MSLATGTKIGPYEIVAKLGEGGMGEVYRARDARLDRDVAIKILPELFASDAERLARFEREAKALAALNHPNIAAIYGIEDKALVMELVEGEDLSAIIARGALPLPDALPLARQIADALEAAHEQGIVHRDLKPANIKVRADGTLKILDFGLAKAIDPAGTSATSNASNSPTLTAAAFAQGYGGPGTQIGMIIGTAAYMSPEQAKGRSADRRADIWAFGVVLYEMLTGRRTFAGDDISEVLASVLKTDPEWAAIPADVPSSVRRLLRRCLEKDPRKRLSSIGDARLEFDDAGAPDRDAGTSAATGTAAASAPRARLPYLVAGLGLAAGAVGLTLWLSTSQAPAAAPAPVSRFAMPLPADAPFFVHSQPGRAIAISPDGTQIAYTTHDQMTDRRIRLRRLDSTEIRSIPGTEFGRAPFFSHDGQWLAYFDWPEHALKKVSLTGDSQPVTLQRGLANAGWILGSWCDDGRMVFDSWNGGLRVMNGDGTSLRSLQLPTDEWQLDPQPLPGACRILYHTYRADGYAIHAVAVDGGTPTKVLDNASHGRYLESGHLLFVRDSVLHLAPFDPERLTVTGPVVPAPIQVAPDWYNVAAPTPQLGVSRNGTLVYAPIDGPTAGSTIVSVDHEGTPEEVGVAPFLFPQLALAPNGEDLLLSGRRAGRALVDLINMTHKATTNLVDLGTVDIPTQAIWMPGGKSILYSRYGPFEGEVLRHELSGGGKDTVVARIPGTWICPWSVSPDGRWLVVARYDQKTQNDLMLVDLSAPAGPSSVKPLVATPDEEGLAAISPNGQWFAYTSDKGDGREIFIDKFPEGGQRVRAALTLGPPAWSANGDALYFTRFVPKTSLLDVMAVQVAFTPRLSTGEARRLFSGAYTTNSDTGTSVSLTRDGKRFLMVRTPQGQPPSQGTGWASRLMVVQNWFTELASRKP